MIKSGPNLFKFITPPVPRQQRYQPWLFVRVQTLTSIEAVKTVNNKLYVPILTSLSFKRQCRM